MERRCFLQTTGAVIGSALVGSVGLGQGQRAPRRRPNILFIMSDDHTSQAMGCYGLRLSAHAPTPHIDRIATEGAIRDEAAVMNTIRSSSSISKKNRTSAPSPEQPVQADDQGDGNQHRREGDFQAAYANASMRVAVVIVAAVARWFAW